MAEGQRTRMKVQFPRDIPADPGTPPIAQVLSGFAAILAIADDRIAKFRQVDAQLVCASGFGLHCNPGHPRAEFVDRHVFGREDRSIDPGRSAGRAHDRDAHKAIPLTAAPGPCGLPAENLRVKEASDRGSVVIVEKERRSPVFFLSKTRRVAMN
jgi:hypothetical protein